MMIVSLMSSVVIRTPAPRADADRRCWAIDGFSSVPGRKSLRSLGMPTGCGAPCATAHVFTSRAAQSTWLAVAKRWPVRASSSASSWRTGRVIPPVSPRGHPVANVGKKLPKPAVSTARQQAGAMTINASAAGTWQLGDRTVNRMGFGAMRLVVRADGSPTDRDRSIAVLRRAVELGVNHIDTAAFYFAGPRAAN